MSAVMASNPDVELQDACIRFANDPLGFVLYMFPWGEGILSKWSGPDKWHREIFAEIKAYLEGDSTLPLQIAVASGHGAAKTTFFAWMNLWFMSCRAHPQVVCTANTESQLTTKSWRELAKWHKMALNRDWFEWTATTFYMKGHQETWKANAIPWSENNTEAFAGTHEDNVLVQFDEASKISDKIWEVTDGVLTTKKNIWIVYGNGTRNVGRFYDCFNKNKKYWKTWQIDSRTCQAANKEYLDRLIEQYGGEESDQALVRVRGMFPRTATRQLISTESIEKCMDFEAEGFEFQPKVMGVDIARFGENSSTICVRQGRKVFDIEVLPKQDLMMTAHHVAEAIKRERPMQVFVDGSGIGAGVVDRLRQLNFPVVDVNGGNSSLNPRFLNKRVEMWWTMKEAIENVVELPKNSRLKEELSCIEYDYTDKGRIRLDRKTDIMDKYGFSPDLADALAYTYAYPVADFSEQGENLEPAVFAD
ncbi:MAG: terminase [Hyphomicrobiaceae bacterium]|nr:MAG: terminase [Hyphomicrobiaceae bacterium]